MGCTQSKKEILRSNSGKIYNRKIKRQKKFRTGLHVEKTSEMGAEANFQAAYTTDTDEVYTKVNGVGNNTTTNGNGVVKSNNIRGGDSSRNNTRSDNGDSHINSIPKVLDVINNTQSAMSSTATTPLQNTGVE